MRKTLEARFWEKVSITSGCWEWLASKYRDGYGQFGVTTGIIRRAHRVAYELTVGPIPEGLDLDHLCRNRACVNPAHLEPVTRAENLRRGNGAAAIAARATHCKEGHAYAVDGYWEKNGHRRCRVCRNARRRAAR